MAISTTIKVIDNASAIFNKITKATMATKAAYADLRTQMSAKTQSASKPIKEMTNHLNDAAKAAKKLSDTTISPTVKMPKITVPETAKTPASVPKAPTQTPVPKQDYGIPSAKTRERLSASVKPTVMMQSPNTTKVQQSARIITKTLTDSINKVKGVVPSPIITAPTKAAGKIKQILTNAINKVRGVVPEPNTTNPKKTASKIKQLIVKAINSAKGSVPAPETKTAEKSIDSLKNSIKGMLAAVGGAQAIKNIVQQSDAYTQTNARLNMMNDGLQTTQELQQKIFSSAQDARGLYTDTAASISQMGILAKDAFSSNDELIAFMNQVNKQFAIAGTSAEGQAAAMLQLTQAMGSGVLRGEELNSVFEQAPTIIQTIANQLGVTTGKIRDMASEGEITADVVKNSLLAAADETNAKFAKMPMTFSQVWTSFKNQAQMNIQPVYVKLGQLFNSKEFMNGIDALAQGVAVVANIAVDGINALGNFANFAKENWNLLAPAVLGVAAALGVVKFAMMAVAAASTIAAIAASPVTLAVIAVVAAIAAIPVAITVVVAAVNHLSGSSISAFGVMIGGLNVLRAAGFNTIKFIVNCLGEAKEFTLNVFDNTAAAAKATIGTLASVAVKAVAGVASGVDGIVNTISSAIETIVNGAITGINGLLSAASSLPGVGGLIGGAQISQISIPRSNLGSLLSGVADDIYKSTTADFKNGYNHNYYEGFKYESVTDAYKNGYKTGKNLNPLKSLQNLETPASTAIDNSWQNALKNPTASNLGLGSGNDSKTGKAVDNIDKNTAAIKNATGGEEIKWLKIIAERLANNKVSPAKISIKLDGKTIKESSESALTTKLTDALTQYLATHTDGAFM